MITVNSLHPKYSDAFRVHNQIKDKQIPNRYPQLHGCLKHNQINDKDIPNTDDGKLRYDIFVKAYNETREHG